MFAASVARRFVYNLGQYWLAFHFFAEDWGIVKFLIGSGMAVAAASMFVVVGTLIAPSKKEVTVLALATMSLVLRGIGLYSAISPTSYVDLTDPQVLGEAITAPVAAAILLLIMAWEVWHR